jgi:hypothetical protein
MYPAAAAIVATERDAGQFCPRACTAGEPRPAVRIAVGRFREIVAGRAQCLRRVHQRGGLGEALQGLAGVLTHVFELRHADFVGFLDGQIVAVAFRHMRDVDLVETLPDLVVDRVLHRRLARGRSGRLRVVAFDLVLVRGEQVDRVLELLKVVRGVQRQLLVEGKVFRRELLELVGDAEQFGIVLRLGGRSFSEQHVLDRLR